MTLSVSLGEKSYDIHIERGLLARVGALLPLDRRVLVVTDDGVPAAYAEAVAAACRAPHLVTGVKNSYRKLILYKFHLNFLSLCRSRPTKYKST